MTKFVGSRSRYIHSHFWHGQHLFNSGKAGSRCVELRSAGEEQLVEDLSNLASPVFRAGEIPSDLAIWLSNFACGQTPEGLYIFQRVDMLVRFDLMGDGVGI